MGYIWFMGHSLLRDRALLDRDNFADGVQIFVRDSAASELGSIQSQPAANTGVQDPTGHAVHADDVLERGDHEDAGSPGQQVAHHARPMIAPGEPVVELGVFSI